MKIAPRFVSRALVAALVPVFVMLTGCVTKIHPTATDNPPPTERFAAFTRFELRPLRLLSERAVDPRAVEKIQANIDQRMRDRISLWNETGSKSGTVRTLVIQPEIPDMKFVSGAKRFWVGDLAGSSAIILRATITEKETGKVIAQPEFYAKAAATGGAWTFGATDNVMLVRIANSLSTYLEKNYDQAVGGPVLPPRG